MKNRLIITYQANENPLNWCAYDHDSNTHTYGKSLDTLPETLEFSETVLLYPTQYVLLTKTKIPKHNRSKMLKALPYALEDKLVEDVQHYHFATGKINLDDTLPVAISTHAHLKKHLKNPTLKSRYLTHLIPDLFAVPWEEGQWSILLSGHKAYIRIDQNLGLCVVLECLISMLKICLAEQQKTPEKIVFYYNPQNNVADIQAECEKIKPKCEWQAYEGDLFNFMATQFTPIENIDDNTINLLQGPYKPKNPSNINKKIWYLSGIMGIIFLMIMTGTTISQYVFWHQKNQKINLEIDSTYREIFPNATSVIAPRLRVKRELAKYSQANTNNRFLKLIAHASATLKKLENIQVKELYFSNNQMTLMVETNNFANLKTFVEKLNQGNMIAQQTNANTNDNQVMAQITLTEQTK